MYRHAPLWRRLANAQLLWTLLAAAYVYAINPEEPRLAGVGLLAAAFRTAWAYLYVRCFYAPSVNRVLAGAPRSRARRLGAAIAEGLWPQLIDAACYCAIGAELVLSTVPFAVTNAASVFLSAEATAAGYPPDRIAAVIESQLRARLGIRAQRPE